MSQFFASGGPKYWSFSFSISPSNEYLGLISFRIDWLDLLAVQGNLKSSPTPQFKSINSSAVHCRLPEIPSDGGGGGGHCHGSCSYVLFTQIISLKFHTIP